MYKPAIYTVSIDSSRWFLTSVVMESGEHQDV